MDTYYTGSCLDLEKRLIQHKDKEFSSSFTSKADDWKLFLKIDELEYNQARKIEAHVSNYFIYHISFYKAQRAFTKIAPVTPGALDMIVIPNPGWGCLFITKNNAVINSIMFFNSHY